MLNNVDLKYTMTTLKYDIVNVKTGWYLSFKNDSILRTITNVIKRTRKQSGICLLKTTVA